MDVIIYATGYRVAFPFFDEGFLNPSDNRLPLYRFVVPPEVPNLYFIGLLQPLGAIMPLAEAQAEWVADLLDGKAGLPDPATMQRDIEQTDRAMRKRYITSPRHTLQVDFYPYLRSIQRVRKKGRKNEPIQALAVNP